MGESSIKGSLGPQASRIGLTTGMLGVAAAMSVATLAWGAMLPVVLALGAVLTGILLWKPDMGSLLFVALAYANVVAIVGTTIGDTTGAGVAFTALLIIPVFVHVFVKRRGFVVDHPLLLMLVFLGSVMLSSMVAKDSALAVGWILTYVTEGLLLYFLLLNSIRRLATLKRVIWALLIVGSVLSLMAAYQEFTGDYSTQFGGLARRNIERIDRAGSIGGGGLSGGRERIHVSHRAAGPMGDPNRFAQILIVLVPLAVFRFLDEKKRKPKLLAAVCIASLLGGIFLTYSRGGFLALVMLIVVMTMMRHLRVRDVLLAGAIGVLLVALVAPGYLGRIDTMTDLSRFFQPGGEKKQGDGAVRGRLTEMLAAFNAFLDYPVLGVGPGQYSKYYSEDYMADPTVQFREIYKSRRAHTLVAELAAETGILGTTLFLGIAIYVMRRLWLIRVRWTNVRPELANIASGLFLGLVAYYGTAVFLHLAYQRYYWILLAVAGVAVQILGSHEVAAEVAESDKKDADRKLELLEA